MDINMLKGIENLNAKERKELEDNFKLREKRKALSYVQKGDKVKLTSGEIMEFIKLNKTKFIGKMDDKEYNIPIQMFVEVVEKVDLNKIKEEKSNNTKNILSQLRKGDYFYINKNGRAIAFKFEGIENNKIIGINPIDGGRTKIDMSFEIGKLV